MADDKLVSETEEAERRSAAARLFDVRRVIGGLFVLYGVLVTVIGLFDSAEDLEKAQGVRINLWAGLSMLALGLLFLLWQWLRPAEPPAPAPDSAPDSHDRGALPPSQG